mmetsp:Transcript_11927/g.26271  ORF Transcript_11927/g.26271 Transcript_11927/m.26271 type:complete len:342 (-) Transcript_11927:1086-2111(-)
MLGAHVHQFAVNGLQASLHRLQFRKVEARAALPCLRAHRQVAIPGDGFAIQRHHPALDAGILKVFKDKATSIFQRICHNHIRQHELKGPVQVRLVGDTAQRGSQGFVATERLLQLIHGRGSEIIHGEEGQWLHHALLQVLHTLPRMLDAVGDHRIHIISQRHVHGHAVFLLHRLAEVHHSTRNARDHLGKVLADLRQPAFPLDLLLSGCDMLDLLHDELSFVFKLFSSTTSALMTLRHALQLRRKDIQLTLTAGARLSLQLDRGVQAVHLLLQVSNAKISLSAIHLRHGPLLSFGLEALFQILHLLALATGEALGLFLCLSKLLPLLIRKWHLGSLGPQGL